LQRSTNIDVGEIIFFIIILRLQEKKKKNITKSELGTTYGRIHIGKQNINSIQTRKMKGLKKTLSEKRNLKREIADGQANDQAAKKLKRTESEK